MEKEFVTYEIASELKELGFNEKCFACYPSRIDPTIKTLFISTNKTDADIFEHKDSVLAPLWQQAIRWFYNNHDIFISPNYDQISGNKYWCLFGIKGVFSNAEYDFSTYNEAAEFGILKGIELLKEKQCKKKLK